MRDHIIEMLERDLRSIEHALMVGGCPDYVTYREQVARRHALLQAIETVKRAFAAEEDDDSVA